MKMRPWIFIREGRCPRPGPGEDAGRSAEHGEKGGGELEGLPSITVLPFLPLTPPHPTLNCPCNELPDGGSSQSCSAIVCRCIPGLSHGNRASWEHSRVSRCATVGLNADC
ncbi:uncharacterized [Tachysurus ichikawai]